jgi:hypothetical protein
MARKTILISDLSGEEIRDSDAAQVIIKYHDRPPWTGGARRERR